MSLSADGPDTVLRFSTNDSTWREVEAPIAGDSKNSA